MERLLTLREVAEILRASPTTLRIWASKRKIPIIKVGRMVRVSPQELEKWLRTRTCKEAYSRPPRAKRLLRTDADFNDFLEELKDKK
jgi:excisionase family DNA binding protein